MALDTRQNLTNNKYEQISTDILSLSGCTQIYGQLDIKSGGTLSISALTDGDPFTQCGLAWDSDTKLVKKIVNNNVIYAENGLNKVNKTVSLGGSLVHDTTIEMNSSELNFFNSGVKFDYSNSFNSSVTTIINQIDGKILLGGFFSEYSGQTANNIVRLNSDGTYDNTFCACPFGGQFFGIAPNVYSMYLQPDNKIVVTGNFKTYDSACSSGLVRINSDGSRDTAFCTGGLGSGGFNCFGFRTVPQGDGKILVAGQFSTFSGVSRQYLARLCSDGSLDYSLPNSQFNCYTRDIAIQNDGKILVGGYFQTYSGISACALVRIDCSGNYDSSFVNGVFSGINSGTSTPFIDKIDLDSNGNIIVGGNFFNYSGQSKNGLVRLTSTGYIDNTFDIGTGFSGTTPQNSRVQSLAIQDDEKIIVGGMFDLFNGNSSKSLVRLNSDGSYDNSFDVGTGFDNGASASDVRVINIQENNKILIGGTFTSYSGYTATGFIRLNSNGSINKDEIDHSVCFDGVDIKYGADYSSTYTDRSLVDKAYVLSVASGSTSSVSGMTGNIPMFGADCLSLVDSGINAYLIYAGL